jgi:hypothetical protein
MRAGEAMLHLFLTTFVVLLVFFGFSAPAFAEKRAARDKPWCVEAKDLAKLQRAAACPPKPC